VFGKATSVPADTDTLRLEGAVEEFSRISSARHGCPTNYRRFAMTFLAKLVRKHVSTPRYRDDFVPCSFDPLGNILRAGERGEHRLAFYFWALSQSI
jgi:hypothetical protein